MLKVGTAKQTVTVEATPTLVDTTNASLGTVVNQQAIVNMPLNLREVGSLALLVPGTVNTTGRSLATGAANGSGFNDFGYSGSGRRLGRQSAVDRRHDLKGDEQQQLFAGSAA